MTDRSRIVAGLGIAAALTLVACGQLDRPVGPKTSESPLLTTSSGGGGGLAVCKIGPAGTTGTFSITHTGAGTLPMGSQFTINSVDVCTYGMNSAWLPGPAGSPPDTVTVTEIGATPGLVLTRIVTSGPSGLNPYQDFYPPPDYITVYMDGINQFIVGFKNEGTPTDTTGTGGGEGCTPGYWKQPQHFDSWPSPYTPSTPFGSVFANAFPGKSLLKVLQLRGGGLQALGRHAVAALLSSGGIGYGLTTAQVVAMFNAAYASGNYEATKNIFASLNEQSCPLN